tara:strand:+ start:210 stop:1250 length:1041 start_codon:yes stop_codon:yes gene_type:complete
MSHLYLFILNDFPNLPRSDSVKKLESATGESKRKSNTSDHLVLTKGNVNEYYLNVCINFDKTSLMKRLDADKEEYADATILISSHGSNSKNIVSFATHSEPVDLTELLSWINVKRNVYLLCDCCRGGAASYDSKMKFSDTLRIIVHSATHRRQSALSSPLFAYAGILEKVFVDDFIENTWNNRTVTHTGIGNMVNRMTRMLSKYNQLYFKYLKERHPDELKFEVNPESVSQELKHSMNTMERINSLSKKPLHHEGWKAWRQLDVLSIVKSITDKIITHVTPLDEKLKQICKHVQQVYFNREAMTRLNETESFSDLVKSITDETCMRKDQLSLEEAIREWVEATAVR